MMVKMGGKKVINIFISTLELPHLNSLFTHTQFSFIMHEQRRKKAKISNGKKSVFMHPAIR
jgi:hypothetical protein